MAVLGEGRGLGGAATLSPTICSPTRPSLMFSRVASQAPSAISQTAEPDAPKNTAAMIPRGEVLRGDDPYSLPADVGFVFVLAGQLQITVAGEQTTLDQGDAFTFPANTQHTFRASPQAGRTQVLWVVSPALPDAPLYAQPPASQHTGERDEPDDSRRAGGQLRA